MYIIEGNIGAGKSTFLRLLSQHLPYIQPMHEPLNNWQSQVYGQSLLANFYQDPVRWAYTLETLALICRVNDYLGKQINNTYVVAERSIYSGHYCFAHNSYANGYMTDVEWCAYNAWFSLLIEGKCPPPTGFIYLRITPANAYERIKKRNRHAEKKITLLYLKQIHDRHEEFLTHKRNILSELISVPVLELDCNEEFETNPTKLGEHIQAVEQFIHATKPPISVQIIGNQERTL
jgi:deoxycitidine kinase